MAILFPICHDDYEMASTNAITTTMTDGGRIVIPAAYRRVLGVQPGDEVVLRMEDGELRVTTRAQARRHAQQYVRRLVPKGVSLVNELIRERREAADD